MLFYGISSSGNTLLGTHIRPVKCLWKCSLYKVLEHELYQSLRYLNDSCTTQYPYCPCTLCVVGLCILSVRKDQEWMLNRNNCVRKNALFAYCLLARVDEYVPLCVERRKPSRCYWMFYCTYNLLNVFRALLCPSSGARDYTCVIAAYGV
jgi:surface polysaccharide O-acyltransferase-like enzyme